MSTKIGYTPSEARRLQAGLDRDMAKIEDAALSMVRRVSDHNAYVENALEELREVYHSLFEIVERRTRE